MAPTPQLQWAGFLYNLKHLNASDRDIVMNFTRLDPIFRNVTNITGLLAIPPARRSSPADVDEIAICKG